MTHTLMFRNADLTIYQGEAEDWSGLGRPVDLVITNPYGPLPATLRGTPMVLHQWAHRKRDLAKWAGVRLDQLIPLTSWNGTREMFWMLNDPTPAYPLNLNEFKPEPGGWYPLELARRLVRCFTQPGQTVWDGFMGRGTIGAACREHGVEYIGVERLGSHITLAYQFLGLDAPPA